MYNYVPFQKDISQYEWTLLFKNVIEVLQMMKKLFRNENGLFIRV